MKRKQDKQTLQQIIDASGIVALICVLEEIAETSSCPIAQAAAEGLHKTIDRISVVLLQQRLKDPKSKTINIKSC